MIMSGDVFITSLERGFFGALRIVKIGKLDNFDTECYLIAITNYIDVKKPDLSNISLMKTLHQNRFFSRNTPDINIYTDLGGVIEKHYEYLGNLPLTNDEKQIPFHIGIGSNGGFPLAGPVRKDLGYSALMEWRWENERDEMLKEQEEQEEKLREFYRNRKLEPKAMMSDQQFWKIIGMFDWNQNDEDEIILPSVKYLAKQKIIDIKQFEENLTFKLYCIDTKKHATSIGEGSYNEKEDHFSVDLFLYTRCAAVAKGIEFYQNVLNDPTLMPKEETFEALLSLSAKAYELKTRKEFEYTTGCDYETYSNKDGWKMEK